MPVRIGETRYPAGSYVIDMHQPKRGLANTMLDIGRDVSQSFPSMDDISAWSHSDLWRATVDRFETASLNPRQLVPVRQVSRTGSVAPGNRATCGLTVDSVNGVRAVNALLERGVSLQRLPDGTFVVGGNPAAVREVAAETGVSFTVLPSSRIRGAVPFDTFRIGVAVPSDELFSLRRIGFDLTTVTHTGFNNGTYAFDDFDAFYIGTTAFNPDNLHATQQQAFTDWLEAGGTVVMRGGNAVTFNSRRTCSTSRSRPCRPPRRTASSRSTTPPTRRSSAPPSTRPSSMALTPVLVEPRPAEGAVASPQART